MSYSKLTDQQIKTLSAQGCSAESWSKVEVADGFDPSLIKNCRFEGVVRIGANTSIHSVREAIENYTIGNNVTIFNVESIRTTAKSSFGNGAEVAVLNESGGREVKIFDNLSAQIAYLVAMYRHDKKAIKAIDDFIDIYITKISSEIGEIGSGSKITNCGAIANVRIGEYASVCGASELVNGTINSSKVAPATVGRLVIARNFIISSSAEVSDGAFIENCFIGQGCVISRGFSAENSLFFANSVCMNGEACSIFAGPYTVTHHKSTLLIGGMFSFYNAGSGSNQSNHYYRLGAVHQGILERGVKTASSSYILFPARVGAFSIVKGRHNSNINTENLPFSYIIEDKDESMIVPAANLFNCGAARDAMKWKRRDERKGDNFLDAVTFKMLNPYTIGKIIKGISVLETLSSIGGKEYVPYGNGKICRASIKKASNVYQHAINKYIGAILAAILEKKEWNNAAELKEIINTGSRSNYGQWVDIAGLVAPTAVINNRIISPLKNREFASIEDLSAAFRHVWSNYLEFEWVYVIRLISIALSKPAEDLKPADLIEILKRWKESVKAMDVALYEDAKKEFSGKTKISYGIDCEDNAAEDFNNVRGKLEDNDFVKGLEAHTGRKTVLADSLIARLKAI